MRCQLMKPPPRAYWDGAIGNVCAYEFEEPDSIRQDREQLSPAEFRVAHPSYSMTGMLFNDYNDDGKFNLGTRRSEEGVEYSAKYIPPGNVRIELKPDSLITTTTLPVPGGLGSIEVRRAAPR